MASAFLPFKTNPTHCFYQTLEIYYCKHLPSWKCTSDVVGGRCHGSLPRGLVPSLLTWQGLDEPKLISSVICSVEKYSSRLREPPVKTAQRLPPAQPPATRDRPTYWICSVRALQKTSYLTGHCFSWGKNQYLLMKRNTYTLLKCLPETA